MGNDKLSSDFILFFCAYKWKPGILNSVWKSVFQLNISFICGGVVTKSGVLIDWWSR